MTEYCLFSRMEVQQLLEGPPSVFGRVAAHILIAGTPGNLPTACLSAVGLKGGLSFSSLPAVTD